MEVKELNKARHKSCPTAEFCDELTQLKNYKSIQVSNKLSLFFGH